MAAGRDRRRFDDLVARCIGGVALTGVAEPASYAHAVASIVLGANAVVAVGTLVPIPGYTGWALLLSVVDAAGTPVELRVRRAARLGQGIAFPLFLLVGMGRRSSETRCSCWPGSWSRC